jgi:tRNA threonylcarbamoyladenosine biosynthesis protein TsaB
VLVLAIETSTPQTSVALGTEQGVLGSTLLSWGRGHSEIVVPAIHHLLDWAELRPGQIGGVAVGLGPGLFTGLRVGIAAGKAIAQALRVSMIGVPSLDLLAFPVRHTSRLIVAAIDAKRGEVFYAFYRQVPGGVQRVSPHQVGSPDDLASELLTARDEILLVGDGALRYSEAFEGLKKVELADQGLAHPSAASLVQLAHAQALREQFVAPWELTPLYLRKPDAEINWSTRDAERRR